MADMVDMIPKFHINRKDVACSWNAKGKVIREIIEENRSENMEMLEGVKIYNDSGWVLVLPDGERPLCRIVSESSSEEFAKELCNTYAEKIQRISQRNRQ